MGTYYGVNAVKIHGEPILVVPIDKQPRIPPGELLVAIMCNGVWSIALDVTDEREYNQFVEDYTGGNWSSMKSYLVPEDQIQNCPDEGRQPC